MQFELPFEPGHTCRSDDSLQLADTRVPLLLIRNPRAKRYLLRLSSKGEARVTVPRGGSFAEGRKFAKRNTAWLEQQRLRRALQTTQSRPLRVGEEIMFRGRLTRLEIAPGGDRTVILGAELIPIADPGEDLRPEVQAHLWDLAKAEFPRRVHELASKHQIPVARVSVRDQRSRWGSCSRRGTISLNWRLIQAPGDVLDYLVLHELAHVRNMNHSPRFWRDVRQLCPHYAAAEAWLKKHSNLLK